jgi:hypothetical protein
VSTPTGDRRLSEVIRAFTPAERVTGAGCLILIVSVFLPWKGFYGLTLNGLHGWGLLTLLIALLTTAFVLARSPFFRNIVSLPKLPVTDAVAYILAGAAEAVTIVLFSSQHGAPLTTKFGFYLALLAAALTALGGYLVIRDRASAPAGPEGS